VILRLGRVELAEGRQHAVGVAGEEEDVARVRAALRRLDAGDEVDGVGGAGVLGDRHVVVVGAARRAVEHDVLQDAAEAEGVPDLRLAGLRQADALGVAAPLEVEDAVGRPAVLVVADEPAGGVGREGRLAGA
jgi:hypothetical protein